MRFLSSAYRPLSLLELLAIRRGEAALPLSAVMVTFDDGYRSVAEHAWPIMRRHGVPLTLFVPTAYPGDPTKAFWWDRLWRALGTEDAVVSTPLGDLPVRTPAERLSTYRRLRGHLKSLPHQRAMAIVDDLSGGSGAEATGASVLGWDELRRLAGDGVAIGSHSRTHPLLDKVTRAEASAEIRESLGDLEREIGPTPRAFAYPGGGVDSRSGERARGGGLRACLPDKTRPQRPAPAGLVASASDQRRALVRPDRHPAPAFTPVGPHPARERRESSCLPYETWLGEPGQAW